MQVANLQKAVEALQKALSGKLKWSDSLELPKVDNEVTEQLQNKLDSLKHENEALRQELAKDKENYGMLAIINQQFNQQLEEVKADREETEAELFELKQNSAPATTVSEKLTPDATTILSQLRAKRKKSKTDLADLEAILEILQS